MSSEAATMEPQSKRNVFEDALLRLRRIGEELGIQEEVVKALMRPKETKIAVCVFSMLPSLILYLFCQRFLVQLSFGGIKG